MVFLVEIRNVMNIIARKRCWKAMNPFTGTLKFLRIALSKIAVVVKSINAIMM